MKDTSIKFNFDFAPIMNALNAVNNSMKGFADNLVKNLEMQNRIAATLSRSEEQNKAWEYVKTSKWTPEQLAVWVELTGKLPPNDVKEYPEETLNTLDMASHFCPEHIEAMKQRVVDVLGDNKQM